MTQQIPDDVRLVPINDNILVQPVEPNCVTKSGILLAGEDRDKPLMADVLAVGGGRISAKNVQLPMPIKVGQRILYQRHSGVAIKSGEKPAVLIIELADVLAIVEASGQA